MVKTIDERELQKTTKEKQRPKGARGTEAIVKGWELMILLCIWVRGNQKSDKSASLVSC